MGQSLSCTTKRGKTSASLLNPKPRSEPEGLQAPPSPVGGSPEKRDIERRIQLLLSTAEECQTVRELEELVSSKTHLICYDGFEPSGRMHIAQGIFKTINVNRCIAAGCTFVFWIADWYALMNDKMGGEIKAIQALGEYFIKVWELCGMNMSGVRFLWASREINRKPREYWTRVLDVGRKFSLPRILKCCQIMGRKKNNLSAAQILYPLMQCSDIFLLRVDICQLGLDQRKVNMLARDYCDQSGKTQKPIILSHHMLQGLQGIRDSTGGAKKMSKSNPDSAIFMEDSEEDIRRKIAHADFPRGDLLKENPCLDYIRYIIFNREKIFMGYSSIEKVEEALSRGVIEEAALKEALASTLNRYIAAVRKQFVMGIEHTSPSRKKKQVTQGESTNNLTSKWIGKEPMRTPHVVAWFYPTLHLLLEDALHLVHSLNDAVRQKKRSTLVLADWSAFTSNFLPAEKKDSLRILTYNLYCLQLLGLRDEIKIVTQSECGLTDSHAYWKTVIELGRVIPLREIEKVWSGPIECAGQVVATLLILTDVARLEATEVVCGLPGTRAFLDTLLARRDLLEGCLPIRAYTETILSLPFLGEQGKINPSLIMRANKDVSSLLSQKEMKKYNDQFFFCDDTESDIRKKLRRAYGPPSCIEKNPLIGLAQSCLRWQKLTQCGGSPGLLVDRPDEVEGGKTYREITELVSDYSKGGIHPADLKQTLERTLLGLTSSIRCVWDSSEGTRVRAEYKKVEKRVLKSVHSV